MSSSKDKTLRELLVFITARLIDPAGNPIHRQDELNAPDESSAKK